MLNRAGPQEIRFNNAPHRSWATQTHLSPPTRLRLPQLPTSMVQSLPNSTRSFCQWKHPKLLLPNWYYLLDIFQHSMTDCQSDPVVVVQFVGCSDLGRSVLRTLALSPPRTSSLPESDIFAPGGAVRHGRVCMGGVSRRSQVERDGQERSRPVDNRSMRMADEKVIS